MGIRPVGPVINLRHSMTIMCCRKRHLGLYKSHQISRFLIEPPAKGLSLSSKDSIDNMYKDFSLFREQVLYVNLK